jgi:hypothetical protein
LVVSVTAVFVIVCTVVGITTVTRAIVVSVASVVLPTTKDNASIKINVSVASAK